MAWPGTLTEEEQGIVQEFDVELRSAQLALVQALNRCSAVYEWYWRQIGGGANLIAKLGTDDVVATKTGLAGASALSKSEIVANQMAYIESALALNTDAHRDHYRLAIGGPNMSR
jgi:hypothetical protein